MKIRLLIELEYDETLYGCDPEEIEWFDRELLGHDLLLHSNDVGDTVGTVTVLENHRNRTSTTSAPLTRTADTNPA